MGTCFRGFKHHINTEEAEEYSERYSSLKDQVVREIKASGIHLGAEKMRVISTILVRAQYAHSLAFTHEARSEARVKTGHNPLEEDFLQSSRDARGSSSRPRTLSQAG